MGLMRNLSHAQRVSLAVLVTTLAVGGLEIAHFSRGTSIVLEAGYFFIPAIVALSFFKAWNERAVAFVILTAIGFLAAGALIAFYLTP